MKGKMMRRKNAKPVAVMDIGSNSLRMVIYESLQRAPVTVFNEKTLCGLGKGLQATGRLNPAGRDLALAALRRYKKIASEMGVGKIHLLATAAVRDAADGADFARQAEAETGLRLTIIAGEEEARLSALGVLSGMPNAEGVIGDLGGGSLELIHAADADLHERVTLPLGALRLLETCDGDLAEAQRVVHASLADLPWLSSMRGKTFYAVGGTWRALAKLYMDKTKYPLRIIQDYEVPAKNFISFCRNMQTADAGTLARLAKKTKRQTDTLPIAALLLEAVLTIGGAKSIAFSSFGLREGYVFDHLPMDEKRQDPLQAAARAWMDRSSRFGDADHLIRWLDPLLHGTQAHLLRLVSAFALFSDLGWNTHLEHRAEQSYHQLLYWHGGGMTHAERAFLALALSARYMGAAKKDFVAVAEGALDKRRQTDALRFGLAVRLAYAITGGPMTLLQASKLEVGGGGFTLTLDPSTTLAAMENISRRFEALTDAYGTKGEIIVKAL
jgi:exopolyphosphatase / guanosine-5'-triphosphate,3'-diphosphate pyrophosphatase